MNYEQDILQPPASASCSQTGTQKNGNDIDNEK
jgi:hypothetical protein